MWPEVRASLRVFWAIALLGMGLFALLIGCLESAMGYHPSGGGSRGQHDEDSQIMFGAVMLIGGAWGTMRGHRWAWIPVLAGPVPLVMHDMWMWQNIPQPPFSSSLEIVAKQTLVVALILPLVTISVTDWSDAGEPADTGHRMPVDDSSPDDADRPSAFLPSLLVQSVDEEAEDASGASGNTTQELEE